jgi:hypothetical protein
MRITGLVLSIAVATLLHASSVLAQETERPASKSTAWFGVPLPPKLGEEPAVIVGTRTPRPVLFAPGTVLYPEFKGDRIKQDVKTIVEFSSASRASHEIGSGQLWGRVSGFPSSMQTVEWAVTQLRAAGIKDATTQSIEQDAKTSFWIPQSWEVRVLGDAAYGAGTLDVVLESAIPVTGSTLPGGTLTAPLVYVGSANRSVIEHIDVNGKVAVQLIVPPGNERSNDFGNCGGACFNMGGRDGLFLESILDKAAEVGMQDRVRVQLTLKAETKTGLKALNGVAIIKGRKSDEVVIIDTHADAWFDGAGDNADGLAVTLALARHFAKPEHQPDRTFVFLISAGHHSPGLNGVRNFLAANPTIAPRTVLVLNVEHVAQRNFSAARSVAADGYRNFVADSGEAPVVFGITNGATFLNELAQQGVDRYAVNLVSETSTMQSGETGGFADLKVAKITVMQAPPLYHTTGETIDVISTPGLERMARFLAYFLHEVDKAGKGRLEK